MKWDSRDILVIPRLSFILADIRLHIYKKLDASELPCIPVHPIQSLNDIISSWDPHCLISTASIVYFILTLLNKSDGLF